MRFRLMHTYRTNLQLSSLMEPPRAQSSWTLNSRTALNNIFPCRPRARLDPLADILKYLKSRVKLHARTGSLPVSLGALSQLDPQCVMFPPLRECVRACTRDDVTRLATANVMIFGVHAG